MHPQCERDSQYVSKVILSALLKTTQVCRVQFDGRLDSLNCFWVPDGGEAEPSSMAQEHDSGLGKFRDASGWHTQKKYRYQVAGSGVLSPSLRRVPILRFFFPWLLSPVRGSRHNRIHCQCTCFWKKPFTDVVMGSIARTFGQNVISLCARKDCRKSKKAWFVWHQTLVWPWVLLNLI